MFDVALFVRVAYTQIETMFGRSSCDTDIIVRDKGSLEDFILPIGVGVPAGVIERVIFLVGKLFAIQLFELRAIDLFYFVHHFLEAERSFYIDQGLYFFCFLGGDDDNTVCTTNTKDG